MSYNVEIMQWGMPIIDDLFERFIPRYKEVWVFGHGRYAKAFAHFLKECDVSVKGFVVTDPVSEENGEGDNIISLAEFRASYEKTKDICLLVAVHLKFHGALFPKLHFMGEDKLAIDGELLEMSVARYKKSQFHFSFLITHRCNLHCHGCAFSLPSVREDYCIEQFRKDLSRLKETFGESFGTVSITGGEALLHPKVVEFITSAGDILRDTNTRIIFRVNGTLLSRQDEAFWKTCAENKVIIIWTLYPVDYPDHEEVLELAEQYGVDLRYTSCSLYNNKESYEFPKCYGKSKKWDYLFCHEHNACFEIVNGKIATCTAIIDYMEKFNQSFGTQFKSYPEDVLDIYEEHSKEKIAEFLSKRPKTCDYCAVRKRRGIGKWEKSKKHISEWVLVDENGDVVVQ